MWYSSLAEDVRERILTKALVLQEMGPALGRPLVDTVKGSRWSNLKELRIPYGRHANRILFRFTAERSSVLLAGDDKQGKAAGSFCRSLIRRAQQAGSP